MSVVMFEASFSYGRGLEVAPVGLPTVPTLPQIKRLQDAVATLPNQIDFQPNHYFAPGMYCRELAIDADSVVVGKMHRHEHLVMLVSGEASVWTDKGMERISGPKIWTSPAGVKRAIYTHTDCLFITMHATEETDLDALEADIIIPESEIDYGNAITSERGEFSDALQGVYA